MDILQWFQLLSASELQTLTPQIQMNLSLSAPLKNLLSESVQNQQSLNSILFVVYLAVSLLIKRAAFLAAFLMSCMLFELRLFDPLSEASLYALTFAIYSYVIFCKGLTFQAKAACVTIMGLTVVLGYDAYFYGIDGYYGKAETIVYDNIESLALSAHTILIASLINYRRVWNNILSFFDSIVSSTSSAYNVLYIIQSIREKAYS